MYRGFYARAGALIAAICMASGCVQATRHSNTMYFGTNTTFGIKAGADTGDVPEVVVGYDRQEVVIMPLLANTIDHSASVGDTRNRLGPCPVTLPLEVRGADYAVHPCSFVAYRDGAQDSYSVLASFGADFGAKANTSVEASGGLAQYFATGLAAQLLAIKGGAALVATGAAARESAETPADPTLAALITGSKSFKTGQERALTDNELEGQITAKIRATDAANLAARLSAFDSALGISTGVPTACAQMQPAACADFVDARDLYADHGLAANRDTVTAALSAWATP